MHFITCSCDRRLPFLRTERSCDVCLRILEQTRERYRFVIVGYVVLPEHIHLLLTEPEVGTLSTVMQVVKQRRVSPAAEPSSGQAVEKHIDRSNATVPGDDKIGSRVSWRFAGRARYPSNPSGIS